MGQTHPAKFGRLRRAVMWTAGVVLGLSVTAWVLSLLFFVEWANTPGYSHFTLHGGGIRAGSYDVLGFVPSAGWTLSWHPHAPRWQLPGVWFLRSQDGSLLWLAVVPLWIPAALSASILSVSWTWKRRSRTGHCPTCNYDLTGIDGVCPECGSERQRTEPPPRPRPSQQGSQR